jgi:hypothetical protein
MNSTNWNHQRGTVRYCLGQSYWAVPLPHETFYAVVPKKSDDKLPASLRGKFTNVERARAAVEAVCGAGHSRKELEQNGSLWPGEEIPREELDRIYAAALRSAGSEATS